MQNPDNPAEQKFRKPAVTGVFNDAAGFSALERDGPIDLDPPPAPYVREPLFNKKIMAAWAIAAFVVWFGVTFIAPTVFHSVRDSVITRVEDHNAGGGQKITVTRRGRTIISVETDKKAPAVVVEPIPPAPPADAPVAPATPKR